MAGKRPSRSPVGTFGALIEEYRQSPNWTQLADGTRKRYLERLDTLAHLRAVPLEDIRRRHVMQLRDKLAATPGQAALTVAMMSLLLNFAVDREYIPANPAARVKKPTLGRWKRWNDAEVTLITTQAKEPIRRAALLAVETGQRLGDLIAMTWTQWDGAGLRLKQQKTGQDLYVPASARLLPEIKAWRAETNAITILTDYRGKPWQRTTLQGNWQIEMRRLGLQGQGLTFHGMRATLASRLAEQGATTHEIAAVTGHQTLAMIERYTKDADQERRASAAVLKLDRSRGKTTSRKGSASD